MNNFAIKTTRAVLIVAAAYYILTTAFRFLAVVPLDKAATFFSMNFEEEVLYPIWRFAHGGPIYTDSSCAPFDQNWYNWIFFAVHGLFARMVFSFGVADEWLPTISRLLSASVLALLGFTAWHLLRGKDRLVRTIGAILSSAHPYYLFWAFFARPDFMALTFEAAAVYFYASFLSLQRKAYFYSALLLCYAAWSAKQSFIQVALAIVFHLLLSLRIRLLGTFLLGLTLLIAGTLLIGGEHYRHAMLFSQLSATMTPYRAWHLFMKCTLREPHILFGLIMATGLVLKTLRSRKTADVDFFIALVLGIAFGIAFISGSKSGADTNYYIPTSFFACILIFRRLSEQTFSSRLAGVVFALLMVSPLAYSASTWSGILKTRQQWQGEAEGVRELQALLPREKGPAYVISQYGRYYENAGNLPWVNPHSPHFVLSYGYPDERDQGRQFQYGGLGGMIRQGMIPTIVSASNKNYQAIDGADLSRYRNREIRGFWRIYRLDSEPVKSGSPLYQKKTEN